MLKFTETYSKSVATTLRLVEPWMGSGRCVVGDSWFGNVGCAAALADNGLTCVFAIKTAHRFFPADKLTALLTDRRGDHVTATATFKGQKVHALAWGDRHKKKYVFTAGVTLLGPPATKRRQDGHMNTFKKLVPRPAVLGTIFYKSSHVIDDGNRTQADLCRLEFIWKCTEGWTPFIRGMKAACFRDAFNALRYLRSSPSSGALKYDTFACALASELLGIGPAAPSVQRSPRIARAAQSAHHRPVAMMEVKTVQNKRRHSSESVMVRNQQWCKQCAKRAKETKTPAQRRKTQWRCAACGPNSYCCGPQQPAATDRGCWKAHVDECEAVMRS